MERALLQLLEMHSSLALATCDQDGRITLETPAMEAMFGSRFLATMQGGAGSVPLHDARGELLSRDELPLLRARQGHTVIDQVVCWATPDGLPTFLRLNAAPLTEAGGAIHGAILLAQDVTTEWVAIRRQSELRDRLVTTINHELRTPLTKILGHCELVTEELTEDKADPAAVDRSVAAITKASLQLADLATKLTNLADLEATSRANRVTTDVVTVVRRAVDAQRRLIALRGTQIEISTPTTLTASSTLTAHIDSVMVERATRELLNNAVTHAPPRTAVTVGVQERAEHVDITVSDLGPGIPAADKDRLLQPFENAGSARESGGRPGLGLALVSAVCAAHGGSILLEDNAPTGLTARMRLKKARR